MSLSPCGSVESLPAVHMGALFCEQGKSTRPSFSTELAVFTPRPLRRSVRGSFALEDKPDDGVGKELDDLGARAQGTGVISAGTDDLGVSVCFLRIHVALRVALETKRRFETPIWDSDRSKNDGRLSSSSGTGPSDARCSASCSANQGRARSSERSRSNVIGSSCGPCARTCAALARSAKRRHEPLRNTAGTASVFRLAVADRRGSKGKSAIRNITGTMQLIA